MWTTRRALGAKCATREPGDAAGVAARDKRASRSNIHARATPLRPPVNWRRKRRRATVLLEKGSVCMRWQPFGRRGEAYPETPERNTIFCGRTGELSISELLITENDA